VTDENGAMKKNKPKRLHANAKKNDEFERREEEPVPTKTTRSTHEDYLKRSPLEEEKIDCVECRLTRRMPSAACRREGLKEGIGMTIRPIR